ncbi:MAG TPA: peptidylprolyl isomerase [Kofleriaceae bacterium]|nr:peptidylprolyl isomerase [Kofleriaceae bacterium]
MPRVSRIAREPLVHFLAIGAALFALDAWRSEPTPRTSPPPSSSTPSSATPIADAGVAERRIVVDPAVRAASAEAAERRLGRAPTPAEIADETERWIDEEILYREAVSRGLDRDDPVIHQRIAGRMSYVLEQALVVPEPTDAELRAWFDSHREQWSVPEHVDFTHVFVTGDNATARADELLTQLANGAPPERLGDRFPAGHKFRGRKLADLAQSFGAEFVDGLASQSPGAWVKRTSRHGVHLVRVDRVDAPRDIDFAAAKLDVRKAWLDAKKEELVRNAMKQLRATWTVEQR